ncbi:MAG: S8 family serine peptidase [bacterium]|jgi:subtilisin family serine protease|nr:S8 family serine peptidase [candidate division KSB1 bacterium]MDH7560608.1 S8 family serine peptidase [bacterium]
MKRLAEQILAFCALLTLSSHLVGDEGRGLVEVIVKTRQPLRALGKTAEGPISTGMTTLDHLCQTHRVESVRPTFVRPGRPCHPEVRRSLGLDRIYEVRLPGAEAETFVAALASDPEVEYAHVNHVFSLHFLPNDPMFPSQWGLQRIQASAAWEVTAGSRSVIVGVIDTGIDYRHEDLAANIWINPGEDLNSNGRVDSTDFNGIDDDGNGFVDDVQGWDFTDAPYFADGGDYLVRDNDPADEHGHGTAVAGIIAAVADNGVGIAGLAFGCRLMNLRAGTSRGLLEEDDVASALAYAADNGAQVVNMSFGDVVCTPLLRDAIAYAHACGVLLVASAGNSASSEVHYPSGFEEVLAVGATDSTDYLAGFSNYGATIDLVAPGSRILTTSLGGGYTMFSGTSAAAPFVSALAALIFTQHPDYASDNVRGTLLATADDLGSTGWDRYYGAGRINASSALHSPNFTVARITWPRLDQGIAGGSVPLVGTAAGVFMRAYGLSYGAGVDPNVWQPLVRVQNRQVIDDTLGLWDVSALPDTEYTLRLSVESAGGSVVSQSLRLFVDRTPPRISQVVQTPMLEGDYFASLLTFATDDLCEAAVQWPTPGDQWQELRLAYQTTEHRILLTPQMLPGQAGFCIVATNRAQLTTVDDNAGRLYSLALPAAPISALEMVFLPLSLPPAYLLAQVCDFDADGREELVGCRYQNGNSFGPLVVWQNRDGSLIPVWESREPAIPRSIGDTDGDGLLEILAGYGGTSVLFEQTAPRALSFQAVWRNSSNVWGARIADLDGDGRPELIVRVDATYQVWRSLPGPTFALLDSLPNHTPGSNITGVPHVEVQDFDGDGLMEILIGDYDGDVFIYERTENGRFRTTWSEHLPLMDAIDFLSSGDYDGDGRPEFVVGCHSDPSLDAEHEYDARHWLYRVYKASGNDRYSPQAELRFFGFASPKDFDAGVSSGDIDNDGRDEVLINVFPDFYVVKFVPEAGEYRPVWHYRPNRSNVAPVADTDGDGVRELYFNDGSGVIAHQYLSIGGRPPRPKTVDAFPLDTARIAVTWSPVDRADGYWVKYGTYPDSLRQSVWTTAPLCSLSGLVQDQMYWFAVSAVDSSRHPPESLPSRMATAKPNRPPWLAAATALSETSLRLRFSEPMNASVKDPSCYSLSPGGSVHSVLYDRSGHEVILTLAERLRSGDTVRVQVRGVSDCDRTPIDTTRSSATFSYVSAPEPPYLTAVSLSGSAQVVLTFSQPLDKTSAETVTNYRIEPEVRIVSSVLDPKDLRRVLLQIGHLAPLGAPNAHHIVYVSGVKSEEGRAVVPGRGDRLALRLVRADLSQVFTYPNPFLLQSGTGRVTFANLTETATISIMTVEGQVVRVLEERDGNGGMFWDGKDGNDQLVGSGVYLYVISNDKERVMGKLAVVR